MQPGELSSAPQILEQNKCPSRAPFVQPRLGDRHFIDSSQIANRYMNPLQEYPGIYI